QRLPRFMSSSNASKPISNPLAVRLARGWLPKNTIKNRHWDAEAISKIDQRLNDMGRLGDCAWGGKTFGKVHGGVSYPGKASSYLFL
ncbi:MAG TPA: hypothetical protein DCP28_11635, partial [Cytophagales bacterium]|nr:hypothetical protein [Cytophagales bacterium]